MKIKQTLALVTGLALSASVALPAFAQVNVGLGAQANVNVNAPGQNRGGNPGQGPRGMMGNRPMMMAPGVAGKVTAVSGNIITVSGRSGFGSSTPTVIYTVDATNATVKKNNATSTFSSIAVGDEIFARGTLSGTNLVATMINDGAMMGRMGGPGNKPGGPRASSTPAFVGNGQPIVAGTVSAVGANSLTITTSSNVSYAVDASSAKVLQGQSTITLSNLAVGDKVLVQGTVNGTTITASTVIDQKAPANNKGNNPPGQDKPRGFFGGIGQFFMHIFGF